jgi:hypothetical protein
MKSIYLNQLLLAMLGSRELVDTWWTTPNKAFGSMKPIYIDLKQVQEYLESHPSGQ